MSEVSLPRTRRSARGFTLIEILIVVAIIGILASLALPSYQRYVYRAEAAGLLLKVDRLRGVLAELEATTGRRVGSQLKVWTRAAVVVQDPNNPHVLGATDGARTAQRDLLWCPSSGGVACTGGSRGGEVLSGLTGADLDFPQWGIRMTVSTTAGRGVPGSRDGLFYLVVELPSNNPHGTQVGLAFVDLIRPYAEAVSVGSQAAILSMRIGSAKS